MSRNNTMTAIVNVDSRTTPDDAVAQLTRKFAATDFGLQAHNFDPSKIPSIIDHHISVSDAPIIVWGGDGTVCCVLDAVKNRVAVLALPGGTMNMVHRMIHGDDRSVDTIVAALLDGKLEERELTKATANEQPFFVAAMFGALTQLTDVREAIREGQPIGALGKLISQDVFSFDQDLIVRDKASAQTPSSTETAALAAFINDADKCFDVGQINPDSLAELLGLSIEAGISNWKEVDRIKFTQQERVHIESQDDVVKATLDGEPIELELPVSLKILSKGSRVLALKS